jgi:uncharacterized membrane protein YfhO
LYRASIDGDFEDTLISMCEGAYPQLILFYTNGGARFGVYIEKEKVTSFFGDVYFKEIPSTSLKLIKYTYTNPNEIMYLYFKNSSVSFVKIGTELYSKNDDYQNIDLGTYTLNDYEDEYLISIASEEENIEILVGYNYYLEDTATPYYIDTNKLNEVYEVLRNKTMAITSFDEDVITGQMYLNDSSLVYTSIPYDEGWHVYVDGEEVNTSALGNAFLTFYVSPGKHYMTFKYNIPYFI